MTLHKLAGRLTQGCYLLKALATTATTVERLDLFLGFGHPGSQGGLRSRPMTRRVHHQATLDPLMALALDRRAHGHLALIAPGNQNRRTS